MRSIKEKLANEYVSLKREFDGPDFKEHITVHQISYLTKEFTKDMLLQKINSVKNAINEKNERIKKESSKK